MTPIQDRLAQVRQADYLSLEECSLYLRLSKATIRRRLDQLERAGAVLRIGRSVRVRRLALVRVFQRPSDDPRR